MSAIILNGKELAAQMETAQAQRVRDLQARGVSPKLVVVMAGDNAIKPAHASGWAFCPIPSICRRRFRSRSCCA